MMGLGIYRWLWVGVCIGGWATTVNAQTPVFEDLLTNFSNITGQHGSGIFSAAGYTLSHSGGYDESRDPWEPRSVDFIWYDLLGTWNVGSIEFDVSGLKPSSGCTKNELMVACDSTGLNPALNGEDFYSSSYNSLIRKINDAVHTNKMKMTVKGGNPTIEDRSNVLSWNGGTTYRFRMTWNGSQIRWWRGTPGGILTEISPPSPQAVGTWSPQKLHIQLGATFRATHRAANSGGEPGTCYSLLRVYAQNLGGAATPPRVSAPGKATNPSPANGAIGVSPGEILSWTAGIWANTNKVYFGTSNPPPYHGEQIATSLDPGAMALRTVYYWRIDSVNTSGTTPGDTWTFTTRSVPGDFDVDGDVDLEDFGYLQRCYGGSGNPPAAGCEDADLNGDGWIDQLDFNIFINCFGGTERLPGC